MSFQIGETVGRYRLVEQLGQGGMATVLKAYHAELDRYVAIKVLHQAFLEDPSFLARFQREARMVARLDHPNIVPIYDYAEHEGRPYLVMKYIEGETLKARQARGPLTDGEIQTVVEAIGMALGYAHQQGILHRDIKPSNVILATDGHIYLADFGLARIAQSGDSTLTSDMILGTPQYISPEQALGRKDLDDGTDLYSLGVVLYEMVVGKVPFSADTPFSIIHDHIYSPLPLPRQVNPALSEEMQLVLLKALSKERSDRHHDVTALVKAFLGALHAPPIAPPPPDRADQATVVTEPTEVPSTLPLPDPVAPEPFKPEPEVPVVPVQAPVVEVKPNKDRKFPWMLLALGVLLLVGCLVALWAVRTLRQGNLVPTQVAIAETLAPLKTPENIIDIAQALQQVEQNPDDPHAYLNLAMVYHQLNKNLEEQDTLSKLDGMAGVDESMLWDSARVAAGEGAWLSAARLALWGAERHQQTGSPLPDDLATLLHESVYKAMKEKIADKYLEIPRLAFIDEPLSQLAKARYTFFYGNQTVAQEILDDLSRNKPGLAEAQLLQADFSARTGDADRARQALADLRNNPAAQGWMLQEAEIIERTLP